jgi:hypothetical protein
MKAKRKEKDQEMPPKPPRKSEKRHWFASHRLYRDGETWQAYDTASEDWVPADYDDVPDQLWSMRFRRDGWTFYTDRARECDERGFPVKERS